jgi:hypothetical protein
MRPSETLTPMRCRLRRQVIELETDTEIFDSGFQQWVGRSTTA